MHDHNTSLPLKATREAWKELGRVVMDESTAQDIGGLRYFPQWATQANPTTYVKIIDADSGECLGYDNTGVEDWEAHFSKTWDSYWHGRSVRFEQISADEYEAAAA